MEPLFEFPIALPQAGSRRLLRALHEQLRNAILAGRLRSGARMPSTRALAEGLGISRNTALAAYDLLLGEGYLVARRGSGTVVADALPRRRAASGGTDKSASHRPAPAWRKRALTRPGPPQDKALAFDFRLGVPDIQQFPFDIWRRLSGRAVRTMARQPAVYADPQGQRALREAIARHVSFTRAVACEADDILVTSGAQQAFDLIARVLVTPQRTAIALEEPGYAPARAAFAIAGAKLIRVPVDDEGLRVERLPAHARLVYVTPSHQFPLGCAMSMRRRTALLDFARRHGAVVVEDDYDGEFRFDSRPLEALQMLDRGQPDRLQSVIYVGTFSKSLFPALRIGYVIAPKWTLPALVEARRCSDWHGDTLTQDTLAMFIAEGHLARHVRKVRRLYAARRALLLRILECDFARWLQTIPSSAGLHLTALFRATMAVDDIIAVARQEGVGLHALPRLPGRGASQGLMFGYGAIDEAGIIEGLARFRRLLGP